LLEFIVTRNIFLIFAKKIFGIFFKLSLEAHYNCTYTVDMKSILRMKIHSALNEMVI